MKKRKALRRLLVLFVLSALFYSCKNEGRDTGGWFASPEIDNPTTSGEISSAMKSFSEENGFFHKAQLQEFYEKRHFSPAWNHSETREGFYNALKKAGEEGLSFKDYHGKKIELLLNKSELDADARANLEILLTDAFFEYAGHLYYGKIDPKELYDIWGIRRQGIDLPEILNNAIENQKVGEALDNLKPSHTVYNGLKKSLQDYHELKQKEVSFTKIKEGKSIKPGNKDERIEALSERLNELDLLNKDYTPRDNTYDEVLQAAVKEFQHKKGLAADAVLGNSTIRELNMDPGQRYKQILANLERWRWYPRDLGSHYILINIPNFKLAVVKDGDTLQTHNVIAGSKARQTPVFTDTLEYIVINPQWHIPPTIKSQDIIPKASKNPAYLANNNIFVSNRKGELLDPASIDWSSPEVSSYNFTQRAGPTNPLGRVKIIYPNTYFIYLHDTPAKSLFEQNYRAESSGCVRVENAIDLAAYVVSDQNKWTTEKIKESISGGKTMQVEITRPIQVHHLYWTAWNDDGKTVFTDDVYDLDKEIYTALLEKP